MDNKQAIEILKKIDTFSLELASYKEPKYLKTLEAFNKAIKSLEAWDKVTDELEKEIKEYENVLSDLDYSDGVGYVLAIIEEHLGE